MSRLTASLCIPTHQRPRLLVEAMESGLTQSQLPDEIVVSDDVGCEESRAAVSAFASRAPFPVRYVRCTTRQSLADNITNCFRAAACDLVLLLHDDDLLTPCAVEVLARPFEENPAVVGAYGKQLFITDDGKDIPSETEYYNRVFRRTAQDAGLQPDALLAGIRQQFPNDGYMVKASVAREVGLRPEFGTGSDFDFGVRMGERGQFYFVDEYTAKYRKTLESMSRGSGEKNDDSVYHAMQLLLGLLETHPQYEAEIVEILKNLSPMSIRMAAKKGKAQEATRWYFGPYHRRRIFTLSGIRTGLLLLRACVKAR